MEDRVFVAIKYGMHSDTKKYAISEIRSLLERLFKKAGMKGMLRVTLGARRRGRNHMKRIHVVNENGSSVKMKIKPGDNNTCCEVRVIVPREFAGRSSDLLEHLREVASHMN